MRKTVLAFFIGFKGFISKEVIDWINACVDGLMGQWEMLDKVGN